MCVAAFISRKILQEAARRFKLQTEIRDYYRVLLEELVPVVRLSAEDEPEPVALNWKATQVAGTRQWASFNVRGERIESNHLWKDAFGKNHCLVFCDGFFDKEEVGTTKRYHYFSREDGKPVVLAGMWKPYRDSRYEGDILTIVTTEPNADVADIHDRMPLTLPENAWDTWLRAGDRGTLLDIIHPPEPGRLQHWRVTDDLFKRNLADGPELLAPVICTEPDQTELF